MCMCNQDNLDSYKQLRHYCNISLFAQFRNSIGEFASMEDTINPLYRSKIATLVKKSCLNYNINLARA